MADDLFPLDMHDVPTYGEEEDEVACDDEQVCVCVSVVTFRQIH